MQRITNLILTNITLLVTLVTVASCTSFVSNQPKVIVTTSNGNSSEQNIPSIAEPNFQTPVIETTTIPGWVAYSSIVHRDPLIMQIFLKNFSNGEITQLTTSGNNSSPKWSPDGSKIMFLSWTKENSFDIYLINKDGSNQHPVMASSASENMADWSPDGSKIAFVSNKDGKDQIYVVDLKTQMITQLTNNSEGAFSPSWSPDGKSIVFSSPSKGDGRSQIFITNVNGTDLRQMTNYDISNFDSSPVWCPDSSCIIFERNNGSLQLMFLDLTSKKATPLLIGIFDSMRQEAGLGRSSTRGYMTFSVDQKFYGMDLKSGIIYYLPIEQAVDLSLFP